MQMPRVMHLYGHGSSGNVYKIQLLCSLLGKQYEHTPTNFFEDPRTSEFRALNPNGKVPVLDDEGFVVWESGAILAYLADGTEWLPADRRTRAQVLQWMFFEQYSHEPYIATSRAVLHFDAPGPARDATMASKRAGGEHALAVMEQHLARRDWFVGNTPTLADIALYAYTHVAPEGNFDLAPYPAIQSWIARIEALPGWLAIDEFEAMPAQ